ncbi:MAG: hypothetical protein V7K27_27585 [Nostoc sp.]|uniref:hypothetical protein n=1 Tax=Nostoc sp. TaxID=1180 RepID=UPI002FF524D5
MLPALQYFWVFVLYHLAAHQLICHNNLNISALDRRSGSFLKQKALMFIVERLSKFFVLLYWVEIAKGLAIATPEVTITSFLSVGDTPLFILPIL